MPIPLALITVVPLAAGLASGFAGAVWETTLQGAVPAEVLSRVSSYDWLGSMAFLPIGYALTGPAASAFGVRAVLVAGAAAFVGVTVTVAALPAVRTMRVGPASEGG